MNEDLKKVLESITTINEDFLKEAQKRLDNLTKPLGSLGRLEELAKRYATIKRSLSPRLEKKAIFTFASDHGVVEEGVSAYPKEVTAQMVLNFLNEGAGVNVLAQHVGAEVVVVDIGVDHDFEEVKGLAHKKVARGTRNFSKGPAMTVDELNDAIGVGIELIKKRAEDGLDIAGIGDMGIANTTPSSAILTVLGGISPEDATGRGTGISEDVRKRKVEVIQSAININRPDPDDPLDTLAKVGGLEIAGMVGIIFGAASLRIPVVLDGFITGASAIVAVKLHPPVKDYLFASHCSAEKAHRKMLEIIGLSPLLDLKMRLGEGTGAALGLFLVEAGVKIMKEMATFEQAGVSEGEDAGKE